MIGACPRTDPGMPPCPSRRGVLDLGGSARVAGRMSLAACGIRLEDDAPAGPPDPHPRSPSRVSRSCWRCGGTATTWPTRRPPWAARRPGCPARLAALHRRQVAVLERRAAAARGPPARCSTTPRGRRADGRSARPRPRRTAPRRRHGDRSARHAVGRPPRRSAAHRPARSRGPRAWPPLRRATWGRRRSPRSATVPAAIPPHRQRPWPSGPPRRPCSVSPAHLAGADLVGPVPRSVLPRQHAGRGLRLRGRRGTVTHRRPAHPGPRDPRRAGVPSPGPGVAGRRPRPARPPWATHCPSR